MDLISIVVPCFNEQEALPIFYKEALPYFDKINANYEVIFVDDGSKDQTSKIMKELAKENSHIKYIILSRNFGKEGAMYAGLKASKGDYVAIMDVDLQDPPELVEEMYKTLLEGEYDCVGTRRVTRKGEPKIRSFFARKFYKIINKMSETEIVDGARDFRLMKRVMVDAILSLEEYNRFSKGIFSWVGFKTKWLEYENKQRSAGETKWSFWKLFKYSLDGIFSFSTAPLKAIAISGIIFCVLSVLVAIGLIIRKICVPASSIEGWLSLLLVIIFVGGCILFSLGIIGQYLAKTYSETKKRPIYIEKESNIEKD